ncbi:MAG: acyl carrier protein [Tissierellaceae bacterium]|nr:acyl carrier protein [Tissierellaceae bacterium]
MNTEKVISLISEQFNIDVDDINLDTSFRDDLGADSLDLVELVMAFEDEFGLEIEDEEVETIKTVGDSINYIKKALGDDI